MSIFRDLLTIKSLRESKAERVVRKQREVLAQAAALRESAHEKLESFVVYARREEDTMYEDLCSRLVVLRDIESVQNTVAHLRQQEQNHQEFLRQAEVKQDKESVQLADDKVKHKEAARVKEKFVEWAHVHAQELLRESERKEDAEMEEVAETRRDRVEWDDATEEGQLTSEAAT